MVKRAAAVFFIFLREEGLRLRKRNGFRVFLSLGFFVFGSPFLKKLRPLVNIFSLPVHMDVGSLI